MENIQASSYSYVLEEISPIFVETFVEFREDIACFQNIQALVFRNFVSTLYQEHPTLLCSFIWILLMQISYSKLQILKVKSQSAKVVRSKGTCEKEKNTTWIVEAINESNM